MEKQKLLYLASPYSHKDKIVEERRNFLVTHVAALITKIYGYAIFLPITQSSAMVRTIPSLGGSYEQWKNIDEFVVREKADELWVLLLPGWKESVGVQAEMDAAQEAKKPIYCLTYDEVNDCIVFEDPLYINIIRKIAGM